MKHVVIGIPGETWSAHTAMAYGDLIARFGAMHPGEAVRTQAAYATGTTLCSNRQELADVAVASGATHLLFIDTDMVFPGESLNRLLAHEKPIVGCNYTSRRLPLRTTAATMNGKRMVSLGKEGLEKAAHIGLGMALIETKVFTSMPKPHFIVGWWQNTETGGSNYISEDVSFCRKARAAGFDIWVDHDLSLEIGHVGEMIFTHEHLMPGDAGHPEQP